MAFDLNIEQSDQPKNNSTEYNQTNANYENQNKLKEKIDAKSTGEKEVMKKSSSPIRSEFKVGSKNDSSKNEPKSEENVLYCSIDQKQHFRVTIGQTEAAIRCSLQIYSSPKSNDPILNAPIKSSKPNVKELTVKYYYLVFNSNSINLLEDPAKPQVDLYEWNFRNIRRYGCTIDTFSIEVGRKSKSGAGLFLFYTKQGCTIFHQLAKHVNDLKNETLNNNHLPIKELIKCRPTVINIQPLKYDSSSNYNSATKYDSTANSPSSSTSSIKSTSDSSNLSDSTGSNDFTSLNEPTKTVEQNEQMLKNISKINSLISNQIAQNQMKNALSRQNETQPDAQTVNPVLAKNSDQADQNKENLDASSVKANYNPFINYDHNKEIKPNKVNNLIKFTKSSLPATNALQNHNNSPNEYNDVALMNNLAKFRNHSKQMNNKMSSCSVANLIEGQKLGQFNKLNKSLPQINKIGTSPDSISKATIKSTIGSLNTTMLQANALIKPPRMNKVLNDPNDKRLIGKPKEEPIFESRQELFGYKNEENHYELADDEETVKLDATQSDALKSDLAKELISLSNESMKDRQIALGSKPNLTDTYELLVSTLNKIDEQSLNTLKDAIKKVLNENPTLNQTRDDPKPMNRKTKDQTSDVFFKNLLKPNQQTTINYIHNDCEYAKVMKKKFMKKTIVENF